MDMQVKVIGVKDYGRIVQIPAYHTPKELSNWASIVYKEALDRKAEFNPGRKVLLQFQNWPDITLTLDPVCYGEFKVYFNDMDTPTDYWRF